MLNNVQYYVLCVNIICVCCIPLRKLQSQMNNFKWGKELNESIVTNLLSKVKNKCILSIHALTKARTKEVTR